MEKNGQIGFIFPNVWCERLKQTKPPCSPVKFAGDSFCATKTIAPHFRPFLTKNKRANIL